MEEKEKVRFIRYTSFNLRKQTGNNTYASLQWALRGAYPRIVVYTNNDEVFKVPGKLNYDFVITAPFDVITFNLFLNKLEAIISAEKGTKFAIDCLNTKVENGVRTQEKYVQAKVLIGKDDDGVCYLAVLEDGKLKVKFDIIANTNFFRYYTTDGSQIKNQSELSTMYLKAYVHCLRKTILQDAKDQLATKMDLDKPDVRRTKGRIIDNTKPTTELTIEPTPQPAPQPKVEAPAPKEEIVVSEPESIPLPEPKIEKEESIVENTNPNVDFLTDTNKPGFNSETGGDTLFDETNF